MIALQHDNSKAAQKYLNAETTEERLQAFNESGVRWTELLHLSYFDISRCVIVDSMHNLFLGLVKEHFKGILGICCGETPNWKLLGFTWLMNSCIYGRYIIINVNTPSKSSRTFLTSSMAKLELKFSAVTSASSDL